MTSIFIRGFHLIEILIVLAIISILAAICIPTYSQYFIHAKRLEAEKTLANIAIAMEHYYIEHNSYRDATLETLHLPIQIEKNNYRFLIQSANNHYVLSAIPFGQQADRDSICGTLILDSLGEKNISGNGSINECW